MKHGKILSYDEYIGNIIDEQGTIYIFTTKDLKQKNIKEGDLVSFLPEVYKTIEIEENIARNITKISNEELTQG